MCCQMMSLNGGRIELMLRRYLVVRPVIRRSLYSSGNQQAITSAAVSDTEKNVETTDKDIPVAELVSILTPERRRELLIEIQKLESLETKKKAEDKLAAWRWRSRFGRPSSFHKLGADPTGTFCAIPEGWLKEKAAVAAKPTVKQLKQLALFNALPFIGFGFLDNLIMIVAGDYIDITIGTALGISTLAAAALGNTISDLAGIGSAFYVESAADKVGVRAPPLTPQQLDTSGARWSANLGRAVGVVVGCILGMFPLAFISTKKKEAPKVTDEPQELPLSSTATAADK